jgi:hypothetical protein
VVNPKVPIAVAEKARRMIGNLGDLAYLDVADAISCALTACDSTRPNYLESLSEEHIRSAVAKLRLAMSLAVVSAQSTGIDCLGCAAVPELAHANKPGEPQEG